MKRLLVDVNVLLDLLLARHPHHAAAAACLAAVEGGRIEGWISAHAVTTLYCLCRRELGRDGARAAVEDLRALCAIAPVDDQVISRALALDLTDFEDAVGAAAAEAVGCEAILTRDSAGFAGSPLPALEPALLLALLAEEVREPEAPWGSRRRRTSGVRRSRLARAAARR
jgi:predicted nucleic acid-binding protein